VIAAMNPFDLPGPQFLVFYGILAAASIGILWLFRHHGESDKPLPPPELTDPYLVAYLRAGAPEVWRLATVRLIDRGLLKVVDEIISVVDEQTGDVQNEVERATLEWFRVPRPAISLVQRAASQRFLDLVAGYEQRLMELELLRSRKARQTTAASSFAVGAVLLAVAITKIVIALDRGHKNVGLLIVLIAVGMFALFKVAMAMPERTRRGDSVLEDLKKLFSRLQQPGLLEPGKSSAEVMWTAAVYGIGALAFPQFENLYPRPQTATTGCGSSCGSSCGGGGCGGGCGGCGG
jgi:uncharacterized protein (TIGR04222 family)